ncbi:hypothetical protein H072_1052 [Dactylellina haptotyla CBS 200.50]|uniref:ER-bound oxygenase mpaB/mpaB'/Rubber oxygenase catalytic domain-containing protein n=1 Tax=Dactylellina haptotyla (strain CBS 200.50) TaxID=1284197 RepID=S8CBL4_DACHA|nr:hypothetical protein H072_1052 [Dactylellina haptotyla CBS 200.50]
MVAAVFIASALQLSHPEMAKALKAHSTYKSDPWRRIIRTLGFIYIVIRSNSSERQQVIKWLQKLHRNIPLFVFENNVLVFATFVYGMVKAHELLGHITPEEIDGIVKGIMGIADKLNTKDIGRKVPNTMVEIEEYLRSQIALDSDEPLMFYIWNSRLCSLRTEARKYGYRQFLRKPITSIKLALLRTFVKQLATNVLDHNSIKHQNRIEHAAWWCVRKVHSFLSYFHYSLCPSELTFDGTLDLLVAGNPRMAGVPLDLYREIFGIKEKGVPVNLPGHTLRRFADMEAHLPRMAIDERPMPKIPGFRRDAVEMVKCSYYRGKLAGSPGHPPRHLGVIMDGNRRYSKGNGLVSVLAGHQVGAHKLLQVMSWAFSSGVKNLTVWALSDDNLKRGPQELNPLFSMMADYIREMMTGDTGFSIPDVRFRVVGDRSILPGYLNEVVDKAEAATANNTKFNLQIAIGYGGRSEVTRATKMAVSAKIKHDGLSLEEAVEAVTEADISRQIYSAQLGLPTIDAILRTSGENRLSGFALWESHHAEFAIVEENWPALQQSTFLRSLLDLSKRNRRFGA